MSDTDSIGKPESLKSNGEKPILGKNTKPHVKIELPASVYSTNDMHLNHDMHPRDGRRESVVPVIGGKSICTTVGCFLAKLFL